MGIPRLGLIVNPIAGMGGRVGLKGTDGEALVRALELGARPVSPERAAGFLRELARLTRFHLLTYPGLMGEEEAREAGLVPEVVGRISGETTAEDTRRAARELRDLGVDILLFVGGDGTARDVQAAVGEGLPVLGVPAGVKNYSAVFASTPKAAAELTARFLRGGLPLRRAEVMDVDEEAYRSGRLSAKLYGHLLIPYEPVLVPGAKQASGEEESGQQEAIARYVVELMRPGVTYILGPGTTVEAVARVLGLLKTLLGVDVVRDGRVVLEDASEAQLLREVGRGESAILVSPLGGQGFILGRGSQQISPEVIRRVGKQNVWVLATPQKLSETQLRVDTGDPELDEEFRGYLKVITGYRELRVCKVL